MADEPTELPDGERLQKVLARAGLGSRRTCEDLIEDGRVTVNGREIVLGARVDVEHDRIEVDGVPLGVRPDLVYYLINKPPGVVTTAEDTHGRPTVIEMVPDEPRVHSVGRLDMDTEGLLLVTNDGTLTHRLTHPSFGVEKEYLAQVEGEPGAGALRRLREGVELDDGTTAPARVSSPGPGSAEARHPRGSQPPGAPHVRRGRPPGGATGAHPDRSAARRRARAGGVATAHPGRGPLAGASGHRCAGDGAG